MNLEISPRFFREALDQEKAVRIALKKLIPMIERMSLVDLNSHKGLHLEKLSGLVYPDTGEALYSVRVTLAARALCVVRQDTLMLLSVQSDHDKAYRKH